MELFILYLKCLAALLIALSIHTYTKFNEAQDLHAKGNVGDLGLPQFLKMKPGAHIINVLCCLLWLLILPDLVKQFPLVRGSVYLANICHIAACAIVGWANSSFMLKILGTGTKIALDVIDKKTNLADSIK